MTDNDPRTILLIHGLWMTPASWEGWVDRYRSRGHQVIAPAWPGMEGEVSELRRDPSAFARLGVLDIVDHYERILRELDRAPIVMGHSFGGLVAEILLDRGHGAAGVAIDPAPAKGILDLPWSTIRVGWAALKNPANNRRAVMLSERQFRYAFANTLGPAEARAAYERYAVPGPGRPLFQASTANFTRHAETKVDFRNSRRSPLLLVAGGSDHVVPAKTTRANFRLYRDSDAITELKEFPGRPHFTIGAPGWEAVADYALEWALPYAGDSNVTAIGDQRRVVA